MNETNIQKLKGSFPSLYHDFDYFECEDGWFQILWNLSEKIYLSGEVTKITCIKEKFGTLRVYFDTGFDSHDVISKLVTDAENASCGVCEMCGQPGKIRNGGWIKTLCDEHSEIFYAKRT